MPRASEFIHPTSVWATFFLFFHKYAIFADDPTLGHFFWATVVLVTRVVNLTGVTYTCISHMTFWGMTYSCNATSVTKELAPSVTFSSLSTLKPLNFLLKKPWLIFAYSWLVITLPMTHLCLLLIHHPTSFLLITFHHDSPLLTHGFTLYYLNPKTLPCIP